MPSQVGKYHFATISDIGFTRKPTCPGAAAMLC